jgi:hypothetical protein
MKQWSVQIAFRLMFLCQSRPELGTLDTMDSMDSWSGHLKVTVHIAFHLMWLCPK